MDGKENIEQVNTKISAGFSRVEKKLVHAGNVADLFATLCEQIEHEFQIPFVWFTLSDDIKSSPVIEAIQSSKDLTGRLSVIRQEAFREIFFSKGEPILVNKNLRTYYKLFPPDRKFFVKSLALVPFKIRGEFLGSWNNGDVEQNRYAPEMDTGLLQKLSRTFSVRLDALL